eukprot:CAMPEP_0113886612 /NCGR_PEP_ID=MMETSP0780_2-20120614/11666_1 /TAXON_ID=652834 /ORGANISM="Palpitomonas bilix" /LENGTH=435 /DNA_ID=CAMNT_0000874875 /DNA_START=151 /DNA_END=1458 /DNA_ORIENTATION=- /assembly_acc=CAM_ASM_000599
MCEEEKEEVGEAEPEKEAPKQQLDPIQKKHQELLICVVCEEYIKDIEKAKCKDEWSCLAQSTHNTSERIKPIFGQKFASDMMMAAQTGVRKTIRNPKRMARICTEMGFCNAFNSRPTSLAKCKRGDCTFGNSMKTLLQEARLKEPFSSKGVVKDNAVIFAEIKRIAEGATLAGTKIPQVAHMMFGFKEDFGGKPLLFVNYLSVKSVHDRLGVPIFFYYAHEPEGDVYWQKIMDLPRVIPVRVQPVAKLSGKKVNNVAHKADVFRLLALRDVGGMYFDIDVIIMNPQLWETEPLWSESFVMGSEGENGVHGLCNAVMLAEPKAPFIDRWMKFYVDAFEEEMWSMHSVKLPSVLALVESENITVKKDYAFFRPLWDELDTLYTGKGYDFSKNYAFHFWESMSGDYIPHITEEAVLTKDTNFNLAVRGLLLHARKEEL